MPDFREVPMPNRPTRRAVLTAIAAGAGAALAGCTGPQIRGGAPAATDAEGTASGSPSPRPTPSTTVTAANGPVTVPGGPVRVVVLGTPELDSAMTLGITPVGATRSALDPGLPDYWPASRLAEIAYVGDTGTPDPERIRAVQPQVVLGSQSRDSAHLDELRQIAPTVFSRTPGQPWKDNFQLHAQTLGRQEQAAAVTAEYRRHTERATRAIRDAGSGGRRISLLRFVEGPLPGIRTYGRQSWPGSVLADVGLGRPDVQNTDQDEIDLPLDQLARADADFLFYATYGDPERAGTTAVLRSPAWFALGAVRAHRAFPVEDGLWFQGTGYTGANLVLGELQRFLGG
ncbi:iron complex transport system substrate-binding protein [Streptomyces sp. TLI_235]|nr:iron-siderophore ABC transporter substrate-binding protein [Streptomyces sp. TLI_235]PBC78281.1 iron complex transport system substrate-binding protein [Streptomyces sp. TLI_235]